MTGFIPYWYAIGWISYSTRAGILFLFIYFFNISSCNRVGLESDIGTKLKETPAQIFSSLCVEAGAPLAGLHQQ